MLHASGPAVLSDPATGVELRRGPVAFPPSESEGPTSFALERLAPGEAVRAVPGAGRALVAAMVAGGRTVWVEDRDGRRELRLEDRDGARTLDVDVLPELAVSPDGRRLLYPRGMPGEMELVLAEPASGGRTVLYAGPTVDRPVFRDDGRAVAFVGTGDGGLAALYVVEEGSPARQRTNVGLRAGRGLPPGFVPPPLRADGTTFTCELIRYEGPAGACTVRLPSGEARCAGGGT